MSFETIEGAKKSRQEQNREDARRQLSIMADAVETINASVLAVVAINDDGKVIARWTGSEIEALGLLDAGKRLILNTMMVAE